MQADNASSPCAHAGGRRTLNAVPSHGDKCMRSAFTLDVCMTLDGPYCEELPRTRAVTLCREVAFPPGALSRRQRQRAKEGSQTLHTVPHAMQCTCGLVWECFVREGGLAPLQR